MLTAILASAVLSAQAVEPIDFQLGWKVGDKLTYIVHTREGSGLADSTGEMVMTVTRFDKKTYTVATSQVVFQDAGVMKVHPLQAGNLTMTTRGKITAGTSNVHAALMFLSLPESPIEVGGAFKVGFVIPGFESDIDMKGKFTSLAGANGTVATFDMSGEMPPLGGQTVPVTTKTTFDTARGVFLSYSQTVLGRTVSITLKPPVVTD